MKQLRHYLRQHWRLLGLICLVAAGLALLLLFRLGSITGGLSDRELAQQVFSSSWHNLAHNPLYAPLTVGQWLLLTLFSHHGQTIARLPSIGFGLLTLAAFAYILRRWYGSRTAIYGTVLFGCSSWFLHVSRLGTTDVLYLWAVPTLLALDIAWQRYGNKIIANYLTVLCLGILLYIPGMIWLVAISLLLQSHRFVATWRQLPRWWLRAGLGLTAVIAVVPLAIALVRTPDLIQTWLGLPHSFPAAQEVVKRLTNSASFFIFRGPLLPEQWLDKLPLLDIFGMSMVLLGTVFYGKHITLPRTRLLLGLFIVGAVFFALGGAVSFSVLVPIVYLVLAAGVGYLLHEWLHVFPRNPLARSVGFGLLGIAIALSCAYNLRAYFVAWPHSSTTAVTFHNRR